MSKIARNASASKRPEKPALDLSEYKISEVALVGLVEQLNSYCADLACQLLDARAETREARAETAEWKAKYARLLHLFNTNTTTAVTAR